MLIKISSLEQEIDKVGILVTFDTSEVLPESSEDICKLVDTHSSLSIPDIASCTISEIEKIITLAESEFANWKKKLLEKIEQKKAIGETHEKLPREVVEMWKEVWDEVPMTKEERL